MKGLDYELISDAFTAGGVESVVRLLPWEECLAALRDDAADAIFQITRTPEREKQFAFSEPFRAAKTMAFKRRSMPLELPPNPDIAELGRKYRIGTVEGFSYDARVDGLGAARIQVESQDALIRCLAEDRVDLAFLDDGVAEYLLERMCIHGIEPLPGLEIRRELHLAARSSMGWVVETFDEGLRMLRSGARRLDGRRAMAPDSTTGARGEPGSPRVRPRENR